MSSSKQLLHLPDVMVTMPRSLKPLVRRYIAVNLFFCCERASVDLIWSLCCQVRERAVELARARYYARMKAKVKRCLQDNGKIKIPKFDVAKAGIPDYPDVDSDGVVLM